MKFELELTTGNATAFETKCLLYPVHQDNGGETVTTNLPELPEARLEDFDAEAGETLSFYGGKFEAEKLVLFGCGKREELEPEEIPELAGKMINELQSLETSEAGILFPLNFKTERETLARKFACGLRLGSYEFDRFKHDDSEEDEDSGETDLEAVTLLLEDSRSRSTVARGLTDGEDIAGGVILCRDLCNTPANELSPQDLEDQSLKLQEKNEDISVKVFNEPDLEEQNFDLIRAVGRGSQTDPRLLEIDYQPENPKDTVLLAGKGVTFDSGGISIKPSKDMGEMKFDMSGAAVVISTLKAAANLELPLRIVGLVPAVENMPDSQATRPGDIVTGYGEKSVEILNTDAEGRLILADTLSYAAEEWGKEADALLDYATLTGACVVALGHAAAGLMGNDDELCEQLIDAGKKVGEPTWRLPLKEEYSESLESENADVKNIGGEAGTSVAGCFLQKFVDEDKFDNWGHLDIAGTAWGMKEQSYRPAGATGFGVWLTLEFLRRRYSL